MPVQKNHVIVFCPDSQQLGQEITSDLSKAGYQLHQYQFSNPVDEAPLHEVIPETRGQVILLITDEFLKTEGCLYRILPVLQDLHERLRLLVIIVEGEPAKAQKKESPALPFILQMGQILYYLRIWQRRYLELSQVLKEQPEPDPKLIERVAILKDISSQIGSVLSFLRELPVLTLPEFQHDVYAALFQKFGDEEGHLKLKRFLIREEHQPAQQSLVDIITRSSSDIIAENIDLEKSSRHEPQDATQATEPQQPATPSHLTPEQPSNASEESVREQLVERLFESLAMEDAEEVIIVIDDEDSDIDEEDKLLNEIFDEEDLHHPVSSANPKTKMEYKKDPGYPLSAEEALQVSVGLFHEKKNEQALGFLQGAVEGSPDNPTLRYYYAYALARYSHDYPAAEKEALELLELKPDYAEAWFLFGELAENRKDYSTALKSYEQVVQLNKNYPGVYYRIGLLYMFHFEGKCDHAIVAFEKAIQQNKNNAEAHYCLGTLHAEHRKDLGKALAHLMTTNEIKPRHRFAAYDIAVIYHQLGKRGLAQQFYKKAVEMNPELKTPHNDLVFTLTGSPVAQAATTPAPTNPDTARSTADAEPGQYLREILPQEEEDNLPPAHTDIKTVLITGATAGIGKATAWKFAQQGHRLILTGRRTERLEELKKNLSEHYPAQVHILPFDVRDTSATSAAIKSLPDEWQQIDILVNNAGLSKGLAPIHEGKLEDWETMIDTNIKGLLYMTRLLAPQMVARRSGHIINVASSAGKEVYPGGNVYCATKSAVEALTKAMRLDLYRHNIRVSQVSPGHVEDTEFARVRFGGDEARAAAVYENFQPLKAGDVAEAIYFIATRPSHVNIQDIFLYSTQQAGSTHIDRSGR